MLAGIVSLVDREQQVLENTRALLISSIDLFFSKMTSIKTGLVSTTFNLEYNTNNKKAEEISHRTRRHQLLHIQLHRALLREEWTQIWLSMLEDKI